MQFKSLVLFSIAIVGALATPLRRTAPTQSKHGTLSFSYSPNITRVTFNNAPINLYTAELCSDLYDFITSLQPNNDTKGSPASIPKVVIFDSANPDFFLDHFDLSLALEPLSSIAVETIQKHAQLIKIVRNTTLTIFVAEINGRTTGIGDEFLVQMDMRFAGPNARAGQIEVPFGTVPGSGGIQALARLIGRGRAMQYLLSGDSVDGPTGAAMGWFNEYLPTSDALRARVSDVTRRIALYPAGGLEGIKRRLQNTIPAESEYDADAELFSQLAAIPVTQELLKKGIDLGKNQTLSELELDFDASVLELYE